MTASTKEILDDLDAALSGPLEVRRVETIQQFTEAGTFSRYLREKPLTLALHYDITPAFLILDPLLGTLGTVELVEAEQSEDDLKKLVRRLVDRATYMRHLLLRDPTRNQQRPLSVELVLLTGHQSALDSIGTALRAVLQDTDSLFHVGVSVLCHAGEGAFAGRLRRAFPWLLTATRLWFDSESAHGDMPTASPRALRRVTLSNYRLPGERQIELANARVHLMHGPNGSGKSSFAEALEIMSCGTVQRLKQAGVTQYDAVIRNAANPATPATVTIEWLIAAENRTTQDARTVGPDGIAPALDPDVNVGSFRLDQPLMDRLIGNSPHDRARTFVDAFFPKAMDSRTKYEQASERHQQALLKVSPWLDRLTSARATLVALQDHKQATSAPVSDPFPVVLNRWLARIALLDLLQRQRVLLATIAAAQASGWRPFDAASDAAAKTITGQVDLATLGRFADEGQQAVDELQGRLASFGATGTSPGDTKTAVTPDAAETLNVAGRLLFPQDVQKSFGEFGDKLASAINRGGPPTYGTVVIGAEKWTEPIVKDLDVLLDAFRTLSSHERESPAWPGKGPCPDYDAARETQKGRLDAGRELTKNFLDKLRPPDGVAVGEFDGSLIAAINEVMALFTPARWAYDDIRLPTNVADGRVGLDMHLGGDSAIRAELHLNTAELNLFTVALFLLCLGRVPKPLNLLVFDDPLQNMDELTSTALARGIAKIIRLWAKLERSEELLIMFHGYSDLERFGAEVAAANYRLPWLSPGKERVTLTVKADGPGGDVLAVQRIDGMLPRFSD